jgi:uncharacterized membrane protein
LLNHYPTAQKFYSKIILHIFEEKTLNFGTTKNLGGIGALLLFIGTLPYINYLGIIDIVGVILLLTSLYGFASYYRERRIFNNTAIGVLAAIIGIVISAVIGIAIVLPNITGFLQKIYPGWDGNLSSLPSLQGMTPVTGNIGFSDVVPFIVAGIAVFVVLWVFAIIAAFFVRRSLVELSIRSSVKLFSTAGLLLLIGAVLVIVFVGAILVWIAALLLAIAFFTMKLQLEQAPMTATAPPPIVTT